MDAALQTLKTISKNIPEIDEIYNKTKTKTMKIWRSIPITLSFAGFERETTLEFYYPGLVAKNEIETLKRFFYMIASTNIYSVKCHTNFPQYNNVNDSFVVQILSSDNFEFRIPIESETISASVAVEIAKRAIEENLFMYVECWKLKQKKGSWNYQKTIWYSPVVFLYKNLTN